MVRRKVILLSIIHFLFFLKIYAQHFTPNYTYSDKKGEHVILTEVSSSSRDSAEFTFENSYITIIIQDTKNNKKHIFKDSIVNCEFDLYLNSIPSFYELTDLNNDSIKEVVFAYRKACLSGVDPYDLFLVMFDGKQFCSLHGFSCMAMPDSVDSLEGIDAWQVGKSLIQKTDTFNLQLMDINKKNIDNRFLEVEGRYLSEEYFRHSSKEFIVYMRRKWKELISSEETYQ